MTSAHRGWATIRATPGDGAAVAGERQALRVNGFVLPKTPVLDWPSFAPAPRSSEWGAAYSVDAAVNRLMTTSGRAALYQALLALGLERGRRVLVPTYHCPSMVAPIVRAGLRPEFYPLRSDARPDLMAIAVDPADPPVAMIAAHLFGLPQPFDAVRAWCDARSIALIEDCAHCFFGHAGTRPVGQWGDYAIASLTKFFPVPEAGLLLSATRPVDASHLDAQGWHAELKGVVDVLEVASRHRRLSGTTTFLRLLFTAKNHWRRATAQRRDAAATALAEPDESDFDMHRENLKPLAVSRILYRSIGRARIFLRRRQNWRAYAAALDGLLGARPLAPALPEGAAPYVFPLLVDDAERVYAELRRAGMPVFRWDRVWPRTPAFPGDSATVWHRQLLQLLCHQDLSPNDIATVCRTLTRILTNGQRTMPETSSR